MPGNMPWRPFVMLLFDPCDPLYSFNIDSFVYVISWICIHGFDECIQVQTAYDEPFLCWKRGCKRKMVQILLFHYSIHLNIPSQLSNTSQNKFWMQNPKWMKHVKHWVNELHQFFFPLLCWYGFTLGCSFIHQHGLCYWHDFFVHSQQNFSIYHLHSFSFRLRTLFSYFHMSFCI